MGPAAVPRSALAGVERVLGDPGHGRLRRLVLYGEPLLYLVAGALLAFVLGRKLLDSPGAVRAGAIAFVFHPLLDSVCFRPMPDLSEGVLGAAVMATWWMLMNAGVAPPHG